MVTFFTLGVVSTLAYFAYKKFDAIEHRDACPLCEGDGDKL